MIKKDIVVFGTGKYFENYMLCYGLSERPLFAVDNRVSDDETSNSSNDVMTEGCIGVQQKYGVEIKSPKALMSLPKDSFYVIICAKDYSEIENQLKKMGITDYQYYVPVPVDNVLDDSVVNNYANKPYKVGYVPGTFDLFHIGHMNLLRNSKSRCEYLIAGVLTDELYEHFKHKRPTIPFAQRYAIVASCKYVDRTVPVDFKNTRKIDAWHIYHYDCHFSGDDHGDMWKKDLEELQAVGATMETFKYSTANSSTRIKSTMN